MQLWQERVVQEKKDLDEKLKRLHKFLYDGNYAHGSLAKGEIFRLVRQHEAMVHYSEILAERIENFEAIHGIPTP